MNMVHASSIVQWMDIDSASVQTDQISKMFGDYVLHSRQVENGGMLVEFSPDKNITKITDWRGWSDICSLERRNSIVEWVELETALGKKIRATRGTRIPIYDTSTVSSGFHGETKYDYQLISFGDVWLGSTVRVMSAIDKNDRTVDFDTIISNHRYQANINDIGYHIVTKSKFYNCNDFYLWGGGSILTNAHLIQPLTCDGNPDTNKCVGCQSNKIQ